MRLFLIITTLAIALLSCQQKKEKATAVNAIQILLPDTNQYRNAQWDWKDRQYRAKLEKQLGLTDLLQGVDTLEVRLWYRSSFNSTEDLFTIKVYDTSYFLSYYKVYPRPYNFDNNSQDNRWDPMKDPKVDSVFSVTMQLNKKAFTQLHCDSLWLLKSQSELPIADSIGFTDCDSYTLEIADAKRFKYLQHHCTLEYYKRTGLKEIMDFDRGCNGIRQLAYALHLYPFLFKEPGN
ncbi:hypothetical protein SAMN05421788_106205 [Filimonas lacunae]|uniref:Lipoprotein n=1 Tax=Filimonas lacunae TaxID=477680 RepID=A0A173MF00_9BACT|nr:hypothetical protein [Filimonas lacunae]BAV06145.1 hypothetical protein FLA_2160 [Filimonas lacunae]SIT24881.1 hypothetical protein SAMN05421788_106205 [Filimonas lacunae]